MSRTPANYSMTVVRGSTWEDEFVYADSDGKPIDLTGYEARMQVRSKDGQYGNSTEATLALELLTTGDSPLLTWDTAENGRLLIAARPDQHQALNPQNLRKAIYFYSIEIYREEGSGEYVIPLVTGKITVLGEVTR